MDLEISDVAGLLQVSETTVKKWIKENKIPVYQINNQYRFDRVEVENWMMKNEFKKDNIPYGEEVLEEKQGTQHYSLFRAVHKGDVLVGIEGKTKEEVISNAVKKIAAKENLDADVLTELLLDRENLQPTAIGHGLAIPHTRDTFLEKRPDFVTIVFPKQPIEFGALDGEAVHTLFFLFAGDDRKHLHLLAKIAHFSGQAQARAYLLTKPSKADLLEYIRNWEGSLI